MTQNPYKLGIPGPDPTVKIPNFRARYSTADDLAEIDSIGSHYLFSVGLTNLNIYYQISPDSFIVVEEESTGKIVAYDSWNRMSQSIYWGFQMAVLPEFKGRGLTRLFKTMNTADFHFGGDQTHDSLIRYPMPVFGCKIVGFYGHLRKPLSLKMSSDIDFTVEPMLQDHLRSVISYDRALSGLDRREFITKWTLPSDPNTGSSVVALGGKDGDELVGFGTIRWFQSYWTLSPVYANSDSVASHIMEALLRLKVELGQGVFLRSGAHFRFVFEFAKRHQMQRVETEVRSFSDTFFRDNVDRNVDYSRVYAMNDFYPL